MQTANINKIVSNCWTACILRRTESRVDGIWPWATSKCRTTQFFFTKEDNRVRRKHYAQISMGCGESSVIQISPPTHREQSSRTSLPSLWFSADLAWGTGPQKAGGEPCYYFPIRWSRRGYYLKCKIHCALSCLGSVWYGFPTIVHFEWKCMEQPATVRYMCPLDLKIMRGIVCT